MQAVGQAVAIALGILFIIIQVGAFPMSYGGSVSLRTNLLAIVVNILGPASTSVTSAVIQKTHMHMVTSAGRGISGLR